MTDVTDVTDVGDAGRGRARDLYAARRFMLPYRIPPKKIPTDNFPPPTFSPGSRFRRLKIFSSDSVSFQLPACLPVPVPRCPSDALDAEENAEEDLVDQVNRACGEGPPLAAD